MRLRADITDVNPLIDDSSIYMVNDLIFTSAGIMLKDPEVRVNKSGGRTWEQWDIDPFDPVPYENADIPTNMGDKRNGTGVDTGVADDDQFHGDNVSW